MLLAGKQNHLDAVTVQGSGRVALGYEYGVTAVIGHQEVLAAHATLEHTLKEGAFLHELELAVFLLEESVLNKVEHYIQTHAAHGVGLELKLVIESLDTDGTLLVVTEPVSYKVRHGPAVQADTSFV